MNTTNDFSRDTKTDKLSSIKKIVSKAYKPYWEQYENTVPSWEIIKEKTFSFDFTSKDSVGKLPTQRFQKRVRNKNIQKKWKQSILEDKANKPYLQSSEQVDYDISKALEQYLDRDITSLVEDLGLLFVQLLRARSLPDKVIAVTVFCKLRSGKSLFFGCAEVISEICNDLSKSGETGPELQGDVTALDSITDFRDLLSQWDKLKESELVQKSARVYKFAIAVGVFSALGIQIDKNTLLMCKKEMGFDIMGANFIVATLDAITLVIQRALMFKHTGKWSTFFHGPQSYGAWYDAYLKVKRESNFQGNLEAVGSSYHQFTKDLHTCLEQGEAILKFGKQSSGIEIKSIKGMLNDLKMIKATLNTYNEAQRNRRPPFSLLVHGGSSLAKSTFVDMLFKYMGNVWNLPIEEQFKYSRNTADAFWSGWNSSKWFILLDDIAYINPSRPDVDNSLMEMIQLVNDVPLVPNQAALEDKGKNPVRARAVVATTNIKHLNAHARFACPLAVQRRLPFVINLAPKPEFARDDSPNMIDPAKLPAIVDNWPDFWLIKIERVKDAGDGFAEHEEVAEFSDINLFLDWLKEAMNVFDEIQSKANLGSKAMTNFKVCNECNRVQCECQKMQAEEFIFGSTFSRIFRCSIGETHETYHYDDHQEKYYCKSTVFNRDGQIVRENVRPISDDKIFTLKGCIKKEEISKVEAQLTRREYADIINESLSRMHEVKVGLFKRCMKATLITGCRMYAKHAFIQNAVDRLMEWQICRKLTMKCVYQYGAYSNLQSRESVVMLGSINRAGYLPHRWKKILQGLSIAAVIGCGIYFVTKKVSKPSKKVEKQDDKEVINVPSEEVKTLNGGRPSVPDSFFAKTEKENVWKRDDYEVSSFDMTPLNQQYSTLPLDQLAKLIRRNVVRMYCRDGNIMREGNAFCVGGHLWVTNAHLLFKDSKEMTVRLCKTALVEGTSANITLKLRKHEVMWDLDRDQAWFQVLSWETKRDLRPLIAKPLLAVKGKGALIGFGKGVEPRMVNIDAVQKGMSLVPKYEKDMICWNGWTRGEPTIDGDCGMPFLLYGKPCTAIVGIHMMGSQANQAWSTSLDTDLVDKAVAHFDRPLLQCRAPELSAPSKIKKLIPLKQKATVRWLREGSINVFGSYDEYLPTPRTKVTKTLLSDKIIAERNWKVDAHAPNMSDWRPWHLALKDVVSQSHGAIDTVKLRQCAQAYVDDILAELTQEDLDTLQVLSDKAVVNGIPGVKFIDKMNFKSSMGEPYRQSKKFFLDGEINDRYFTKEAKERIDKLEELYNNGVCGAPIFCAQIKDEAKKTSKISQGALRIFTGGAFDYCVVVRKYLLTFVKLMQEKPFLFESSPGCAAQSAEWEAYYEYLTKFGFDRMVAGDYGKFDKLMEASIILEAYWIMIQILRAAGWSDKDLIVIWCIAEDTAHSYCNFNGDLVQFFGSNPSGHPLTVIVNCLVNVLYMRYCFASLSPSDKSFYHKAREFKKNVALLTYGDDNTMGVSKDADWFNHTAIQGVLASIGVRYTMADKEAQSVPFIHIRDVSYLKRKWRWDEDIEAVVCPLEEESIHKMLTVCIPSSEVSAEFHMASVMISAINEWFWYGRRKFEQEREWLMKLALANGIERELQMGGFPTWDELYARYWKSSIGVPINRIEKEPEVHPRDVVGDN